jgi:hypothetical protein
MATFGVLAALFFIVFGSVLSGLMSGHDGLLLGSGIVGLIVFPIINAIIGFISGAIAAFLYNLVAGFVGGIEIDVE